MGFHNIQRVKHCKYQDIILVSVDYERKIAVCRFDFDSADSSYQQREFKVSYVPTCKEDYVYLVNITYSVSLAGRETSQCTLCSKTFDVCGASNYVIDCTNKMVLCCDAFKHRKWD